MKTTKFKVQILGADNGSGEFERGGDLDFQEVESLAGHGEAGFEKALPRAIAGALLTDRAGDGDAAVYDARVVELGSHFIVTMSINEEGVGEQNFVFCATEVE